MFFNSKQFKEKVDQAKKDILKEEMYETRKVTEQESLLERRAAIERLDFWGAETIKEAKEIEKRLELLKEEKEYKEWFDKHKDELRELFNHMKRIFLEGSDVFEMLYSGEDRVLYAGIIYNRDNLIKLLKRYGYHCVDHICEGVKTKMEIRLERGW